MSLKACGNRFLSILAMKLLKVILHSAMFRNFYFSFHFSLRSTRAPRFHFIENATRALARATRKFVLIDSIHFRRTFHWNNKRRMIFACRETSMKSL